MQDFLECLLGVFKLKDEDCVKGEDEKNQSEMKKKFPGVVLIDG